VSARVVALTVAPVKGLRALEREQIALGPDGVRENRRFLLINPDAQMVNAKRLGSLQTVVADYDDAQRTLSLSFPDGSVAAGVVETGRRIAARFFDATIAVAEVLGPFSQALAEQLGTPLRLVESVAEWGAVDRGREATVTLISSASIERLGVAAGAAGPVDARRFRMLVQVDGVAAHTEDGWVGRPLAVGGAVVAPLGHVGRCVVTKRDPDSGEADLDTLRALASYRSESETTEPLACGVYGTVLQPGAVRLGDPVEPA
jgi:uncharacterized protein YcbX